MNIECPICKKQIARDYMGISAHLRRKDHNLTKAQVKKHRDQMLYIKPETGSMSRKKENKDIESALTKSTGIK